MSHLLRYLDRKGIPLELDLTKVYQSKSNSNGKRTEIFFMGVNSTIIIDIPFEEFSKKWNDFNSKQ